MSAERTISRGQVALIHYYSLKGFSMEPTESVPYPPTPTAFPLMFIRKLLCYLTLVMLQLQKEIDGYTYIYMVWNRWNSSPSSPRAVAVIPTKPIASICYVNRIGDTVKGRRSEGRVTRGKFSPTERA